MISSSFWTVAAATGASIHVPFWKIWRDAATRRASARRSASTIETVSFTRSPGARGLAYQSVMMTPEFASAWSKGANETVSTAAFHRYPFTPIVVIRDGASCDGRLRFLAQPALAKEARRRIAAALCRRGIGDP